MTQPKPQTGPLHQLDFAGRMLASQLSTLLKVSGALASSLELATVLQTAIESACEVLALETGAIYELDDGALYLGATTPPLRPEDEWLRLKPEKLDDHPHIQKALKLESPVYTTDANHEAQSPAEAAIRDARHLVSILYIPLLLERNSIGALILGTTGQVREFTKDEIDLCRVLATQVSLAVTNARLYRNMQQANRELTHAYDATLLGWSLALDMRDQATQGHTRRVTQMTLELARSMGVNDDDLLQIQRGALLHDIGKMSLPDSILKKPGPLSEEEWGIMRRHPEYAYNFLKQIEYLAPALEIPYHHHEHWDGGGYPRGLKGEQIPFSARIFAVADVYDALTSERPYRPAWSIADARAYILAHSGSQFDPQVVEAFKAWCARG